MLKGLVCITFLSAMTAEAEVVIPAPSPKKICSVPGKPKSRAILGWGKVQAKDAETLQKSESNGMVFTSNLLVADVTWNCPVSVLNALLKKHRACIIRATDNAYVYFQFPGQKLFPDYQLIETDFRNSVCIENILPPFDVQTN